MKTDKDFLPDHYELKEMPFYSGNGNLNVTQLEALCNDFKEYCHQQGIIKDKLRGRLRTVYGLTAKTGVGNLEFISKLVDV